MFTVPPASTQSFVFIIPSSESLENGSKDILEDSLFQPILLESWLRDFKEQSLVDGGAENHKTSQEETLIAEYNGKLLRNFVSNALKAAVHAAGRSAGVMNAAASLPSKRTVKTELPSAIQLFSALAIGLNILMEPHHDEEFRRAMITESPGVKGIIQQVEAALRKRIDLVLDVDNVYSKR